MQRNDQLTTTEQLRIAAKRQTPVVAFVFGKLAGEGIIESVDDVSVKLREANAVAWYVRKESDFYVK